MSTDRWRYRSEVRAAQDLWLTPDEGGPMATDVADRLAGTWTDNLMHCSATFAVRFVVTTFRARFADVQATLQDGRLTGTVAVASLAIADDHGFKGHVLASDFFAVDSHPTIAFASEALAIDGDAVNLEGQLTLKGVTRPVHATGMIGGPLVDANGFTLLGFSLQTVIDRTAFGLTWNTDLPAGGRTLADDVAIDVELEFMKIG